MNVTPVKGHRQKGNRKGKPGNHQRADHDCQHRYQQQKIRDGQQDSAEAVLSLKQDRLPLHIQEMVQDKQHT